MQILEQIFVIMGKNLSRCAVFLFRDVFINW